MSTSNTKINKTLNNMAITTPNNMAITSGICKGLPISGTKMIIKFHGSLDTTMVSERSTIKKILNVNFLRQVEPQRCGRNLNPKKVTKRI